MKVEKLNHQQYLVLADSAPAEVTKDWFDPEGLTANQEVIGQSIGRGITYFFKKADKAYVLRRYLRGGLFGKLVKQGYFFTGLEDTRAYKEQALLEQMSKMDLPVPSATACLISKGLFSYRASIVIGLIPQAEDLYHHLLKDPLTKEQWQTVGALIKQFHQKGIYHSDLNIHNILKDADDKLWLIDFDKGLALKPDSEQLQTNLPRLLRSLRKEKTKQPYFNWNESDWTALLQGYQANS